MKSQGSFSNLAEEINAYMRELAPPAEAWLGVLQAEWGTLVGDAVAAHTCPASIEHHVLCINVSSHAWLAELRGRIGQMIQQKVRERTQGDVTRIRWQLGPSQTARES